VQVDPVDPMKPGLKVPRAKRLNLIHDELLSNVAFKFNLRRYTVEQMVTDHAAVVEQMVGWYKLTVSKPVLKAPMVSALELRIT